MKAAAFNGSPRPNGNTQGMIKRLLRRLERDGIECEVIQVGGKLIRGCRACGSCRELRNGRCVMDDDLANEALEIMAGADVVILGSPTYFAAITPEMKALIDRCGYVSRANGGLLRRKVGAALVAVRRAGALNVFQAINNFFLINEMIVPGSTYWNLSVARDPGDSDQDAEGLATIDTLGDSICWLLGRIGGYEKSWSE